MLRMSHASLPFQSTLSVRRATPQITVHDGEQLFQSTLSVRRATGAALDAVDEMEISIHALREESDYMFAS